jgi:hypothetical protein
MMCGVRGFPVDRIRDTRYGYVNAYPAAVLHEVFQSLLVSVV